MWGGEWILAAAGKTHRAWGEEDEQSFFFGWTTNVTIERATTAFVRGDLLGHPFQPMLEHLHSAPLYGLRRTRFRAHMGGTGCETKIGAGRLPVAALYQKKI
jgi:hypothetical protein